MICALGSHPPVRKRVLQAHPNRLCRAPQCQRTSSQLLDCGFPHHSNLILPFTASAQNRTTADYHLSLPQPKRSVLSCWTKNGYTPTTYVSSSSTNGTHGERVSIIHHVDATGCLVSISMSSIMATKTRILYLLLTGPFTDAH